MSEVEIAHYLTYTLFVIPACWGGCFALGLAIVWKAVTDNRSTIEDI